MICRICYSKKVNLFSKYSFFDIYSCNNCSTLFSGQIPSDKKILKTYNKNYMAWKGDEQMKRKTYANIFNLLEKYTTLKNKKLLDVGCATGYLLKEGKARQMDCFGVEISPYASQIAKKSFPKRIFSGTLEKTNYSKNSFDIITMIDLIEHTKSPIETLARVRKILRNGGFLIIVTPNYKSIWARIFGKYWTNFKEEHLYYFCPKSLDYISKKLLFKIIYSTPAKKFLTLDYIYSYLRTYPMPILTAVSTIFLIFPKFIRNYPFPILTDDLMLVLQRIP